MAKIDVIMPQMGESIAEGTLSRWIKKVGEAVKRDEPIFEISTDKVDAEIPSPAAGVLAEILVAEGQTVAVQTVVAKIETEAGAATAATSSAPASPAPGPAASPARPSGPSAPAAAPAAASPPRPPAAPSAPAPAAPARVAAEAGAGRAGDAVAGNGMETAEDRLHRKSTPLVRKMAAEHNLDLSAIPGTGLAGRVTKNDILNYIEAGPASAAPAVAPSGPAP
ncbi:MAG: biotin/lipoyl-containing protein, partial [Gemmatimonadales bacterium]